MSVYLMKYTRIIYIIYIYIKYNYIYIIIDIIFVLRPQPQPLKRLVNEVLLCCLLASVYPMNVCTKSRVQQSIHILNLPMRIKNSLSWVPCVFFRLVHTFQPWIDRHSSASTPPHDQTSRRLSKGLTSKEAIASDLMDTRVFADWKETDMWQWERMKSNSFFYHWTRLNIDHCSHWESFTLGLEYHFL